MPLVRPSALAFAACVTFAASVSAKPSLLPLKRVRFYETGIAYFERTGAVGSNEVTLPVPASHLDDALKTLVVYSKDGASRVGGVEFASSVSRGMARALAGIGPSEGRLGLVTLLESLKGAAVELALEHAAPSVAGRLVDVMHDDESDLETCVPAKTKDTACEPQKTASLVVLTKAHELRRIALRDVRGVRPVDPALAARIGAALDALSGGSARVLKDLRVLARGHSVSLGYVSEAPVWRASYRLVLDDAGKRGALQGWALLHNDTDEDWRAVAIELVNGRPDSFLFPLAAPRYAERPLVTPENPLSTVPQLMRTTPDALWTPEEGEASGVGGLGLSGYGEGGGGRGEGIGLGSIGTLGHGAGGGGDSESDVLSIGSLASVASADGAESGALFRYSLAEKLALRAHGSALVPFVGEELTARRVALFDSAGQGARSAVYLTHQGNQTLPPGTIAVFSDSGFAGEAALPRLKPRETTTLEYGSDLDVSLEETSSTHEDEAQTLRFERWALIEHYVRHHHIEEHLENRSGAARDAFLALAYVNNAVVKGADEIVYDSRKARAFASFSVAAREQADRVLTVDEGLSRRHAVATLKSSELETLADAATLPAEQRALVREAQGFLAKAEAKRRAVKQARAELAVREAEAERFREHARALGAVRGTEKVVARLLAAEDRADALRRSLRALEVEVDTLARASTRALMRLPS